MENEIKAEEMINSTWYVVEIKYKWLINFSNIEMNMIYCNKFICFDKNKSKSEVFRPLGDIRHVTSIRLATKEEVLKYFPDEQFEKETTTNKLNMEIGHKEYAPAIELLRSYTNDTFEKNWNGIMIVAKKLHAEEVNHFGNKQKSIEYLKWLEEVDNAILTFDYDTAFWACVSIVSNIVNQE